MMTSEAKINREIFLKRLGRRIQSVRKTRKMTQESLAEITGLDRTTISRIESGDIETALYHVYLIALALRIEVKDLFDF